MATIARWAVLPSLVLAGCGSGTPAEPCEPAVVSRETLELRRVSILLVVDDSEDMGEEQQAIAAHMPDFLEGLERGDRDGDGIRDFDGIPRIEVGVVTTRMGTGGIAVAGCGDPDHGDDGILRTAGDAGTPGCADTYPSFVSYSVDVDPETVGAAVGCVARVGTDGCPHPQPLEAALKAITPSTSSIVFADGTRGHGDHENMGFFGGSPRVIVLVTDRDDCSVADPELLDPSSDIYSGDATSRCTEYPAALHRPERYADGFLASSSLPRSMLYAVVAGVPPELLPEGGVDVDYGAILDAPAMQVRPDPSGPGGLAASCTSEPGGSAAPPRRLVIAARAFAAAGGQALLTSVCEPELTQPLGAIRRRIATIYENRCTRGWVRGSDGLVDCDLIEMLAAEGDAGVTRCEDVPGRETVGAVELADGRSHAVCRVTQLAVHEGTVDSGDGWFIDDFSRDASLFCPGRGALAYTHGAYRPRGSTSALECDPDAAVDRLYVGSSCPTPDASCAFGEEIAGRHCLDELACDPRTQTMRVPCESRVDDGGCDCQHGFCAPASCRTVPSG